ncbi:MAG: hypothetical protein PHI48_05930 [Bacteroidales bacterium]|nr:hypothetical protein [Bacteroidales bacterium]MDD4822080.1 hypothetical protein [Bacteroidales bacterium]
MKNSIYIVCGILLFIIAVAWGVNKFIALSNAEKYYQVNLFSLIPSDNNVIFYTDNFIRYEKALSDNRYYQDLISNMPDKERPFLNKVSRLLHEGKIPSDMLSKELIISFCKSEPDKLLFLMRMQEYEKSKTKKLMDEVIFPDYTPIKERYKEATFYFYPLAGGDFFCCTFFRGSFAGSKSRKQIERLIDLDVIKESQFNQVVASRGNNVIGSVFYEKTDSLSKDSSSRYWTTFDLFLEKEKVGFSGFYKMPKHNLVSGFRNQTPLPVPASGFFPENTICYYYIALTDYPFYMLQKGLYPQDTTRFFLNDSINAVSYFEKNMKQSLLSLHFRDSIGICRNMYCIEMKDSLNAFDAFQSELLPMENAVTHRIKTDNNSTITYFELPQQGLLAIALGEEFKSEGDKEFVSFQGNTMMVSDSIESILSYLSEMERGSQSMSLAKSSVVKDFKEDCNGILWANFKDAPELKIKEREKIKSLFEELLPLTNCQTGIQWNFENNMLYETISIRPIL